ncbi:MAG: hypothetical protein J3R72DRAFT_227319 [Linnemannia gamsii]|nr:MAG: hypothetical protein J3R72DRAFT_227319 [Linnemannia gamsii]
MHPKRKKKGAHCTEVFCCCCWSTLCLLCARLAGCLFKLLADAAFPFSLVTNGVTAIGLLIYWACLLFMCVLKLPAWLRASRPSYPTIN